MKCAILKLYCGESVKTKYYNSQEIGLARALASKGEDVIIVDPKPEARKERFEKFENKIQILEIPCKTFGVHSFYHLDFILEQQINIVHLNSDNQLFAPSVIKFCQRNHIIFYNYIGTLYSDTKNIYKKFLMDMISRRNILYFKKSPVVAKTLAVRQQLEDLGVTKAQHIPVGLDTTQIIKDNRSKNDIRRSLKLPVNKTILLFVGRLENYKRPLASLEILKALGETYHLVIIGNGSLAEELKDKIHQEFRNSVSYFPAVPNSSMYQYYKACDWYINLNTHEIFGMSILEAMYQGCPVAARRAPGPEEMIEDKTSGYLCDSDQEMITIIKAAAANNMGQSAKKRIISLFTWEQSAEQLLNFAKQLSGN